jgi:hypothetical protein
MGWSAVAGRSHARRLEREGWLARRPMTRGEGCLFMATRAGVRAAGVKARPMANGARPAFWPTFIATAWTAAWLKACGHEFLGPREVVVSDRWLIEIRWHDRRGHNYLASHRPTFVVDVEGDNVVLEMELTEQSKPRLQAAMKEHARWIGQGQSDALVCVCSNQVEATRIEAAGALYGLDAERGLLRVELVETLRAYALDAFAELRGRAAGSRVASR